MAPREGRSDKFDWRPAQMARLWQRSIIMQSASVALHFRSATVRDRSRLGLRLCHWNWKSESCRLGGATQSQVNDTGERRNWEIFLRVALLARPPSERRRPLDGSAGVKWTRRADTFRQLLPLVAPQVSANKLARGHEKQVSVEYATPLALSLALI